MLFLAPLAGCKVTIEGPGFDTSKPSRPLGRAGCAELREKLERRNDDSVLDARGIAQLQEAGCRT